MTQAPRASDGPRPPRRLRSLLWVLFGLVLVVGAAWVALAIAFPPARVRALVQRQLGSMLAREVRFEDAHLSLWPPVRLTVEKPAIAEPGGFARGAAIEARSAHLDLDGFALLGRNFVIRRFALIEPRMHVVLRRDGTTNLSQMGAPPELSRPSPPMDFEITRLVIERGRVLLDDLPASRRSAFGFDADLGFSLAGNGTRVATRGKSQFTDVAFGPLSAARLTDLNRSLAGLAWKIEHDAAIDLESKRLGIGRLALGLGRAEILLRGTVDASSPTPRVDLQARGVNVDLGDVLDHLAKAQGRALEGIDGGGRLDFDLGIRGRLGSASRPGVRGTLSVKNGSFRYPGAPAAIERTSFTAQISPETITVPDLEAEVAGQPVLASLTVSRFADPILSFGLVGDLDLATVARLVAPKDAELAGRVAIDLKGHGRAKDPGTLTLEGWMRAADVSVKTPQLAKKLEDIRGEVRFNTTTALVNDLSLRAGQSSLRFDASVTRPLALLAKQAPEGGYPVPPAGVVFTLQSPHLDLAELLPPTPGAPMLANARGSGRVSIDRLRNKRLDVSHVRAEVTLRPEVTEVTRFSLNAYGGDVSGKAVLDFSDPALPALALDARLDSCQVDAALSAWSGAGQVLHGLASSTLALSVRGSTPQEIQRSLTAQGEALLRNGKLGPAPVLEAIAKATRTPAFREVAFNDGRVPFRIENGRVATGPAKLSGTLGDWQINGTTGFDGSLDHAVSITLPAEVTDRLGTGGVLAAGALGDESGRVLIDLRVGGTGKNPVVRLDERAMRDRLLGRVTKFLPANLPKFMPLSRDTGRVGDSLRAVERRSRRALEDSLKSKARELLDGFFGSKKDTTRP